jgi:hypothetical protein
VSVIEEIIGLREERMGGWGVGGVNVQLRVVGDSDGT